MKIKNENKRYPYANIYIGATVICLVVACVYVCLKGGGALSQWLFHDVRDTGNDFFNSIPAVKGYGIGYILLKQYPPLAKLFFLMMARIYSHNNISLDTTIRNSMTDPRMQQAALMPFIIFILFTSIVIIALVDGMFKEEKKQIITMGTSIIGTYSVLFAIERGNIILLSFMFLMYFIAYYHSEDKVLKETALISLALSAGIKLYPATFGVLLLYEKKWKEAFRTIIYGVLALIVPYCITKQYSPENETGSMVSGIILYVKGSGLVGTWPIQQEVFFIASIVIALIGMILSAVRGSRRNWIDVFYAGVLAVNIGMQFTYPYGYVFFIPSLVLFIQEEKQINFKNNVYFILLCVINLPLPIFGLPTLKRLPLVGEIKMFAMFVMMILVVVMEFSFRRNKIVIENKADHLNTKI